MALPSVSGHSDDISRGHRHYCAGRYTVTLSAGVDATASPRPLCPAASAPDTSHHSSHAIGGGQGQGEGQVADGMPHRRGCRAAPDLVSRGRCWTYGEGGGGGGGDPGGWSGRGVESSVVKPLTSSAAHLAAL